MNNGALIRFWWHRRTQTLWKTVLLFPTKLNTLRLYNPAIMLSKKNWKTYVHTDPLGTDIGSVFVIIAKTWKKSRCSSVSEQLNKFMSRYSESSDEKRAEDKLINHLKNCLWGEGVHLRAKQKQEADIGPWILVLMIRIVIYGFSNRLKSKQGDERHNCNKSHLGNSKRNLIWT